MQSKSIIFFILYIFVGLSNTLVERTIYAGEKHRQIKMTFEIVENTGVFIITGQ